MSTTEQKNTSVEQIIESVKGKGAVKESDIMQIAEKSGFDNDQFDHLCELLEGNGIEINYNEVEDEIPPEEMNMGDIDKVLPLSLLLSLFVQNVYFVYTITILFMLCAAYMGCNSKRRYVK